MTTLPRPLVDLLNFIADKPREVSITPKKTNKGTSKTVPEQIPPVPPPETSKRDWKEIRETTAIVLSILAFLISLASFVYTARSDNIDEERYEQAHSVVVVGEKDPSSKLGFIFKLHALDPSQRLDDVKITFPSKLHVEPITSNPGDLTITLFPIRHNLDELCAEEIGREKGMARVTKLNLPIIVDSTYSMGGHAYQERGIYYLRAIVAIAEPGSENNDNLDFEDFAFSGTLPPKEDAQKIIDNLFVASPTQN